MSPTSMASNGIAYSGTLRFGGDSGSPLDAVRPAASRWRAWSEAPKGRSVMVRFKPVGFQAWQRPFVWNGRDDLYGEGGYEWREVAAPEAAERTGFARSGFGSARAVISSRAARLLAHASILVRRPFGRTSPTPLDESRAALAHA